MGRFSQWLAVVDSFKRRRVEEKRGVDQLVATSYVSLFQLAFQLPCWTFFIWLAPEWESEGSFRIRVACYHQLETLSSYHGIAFTREFLLL